MGVESTERSHIEQLWHDLQQQVTRDKA
ncbi:MAG: hypothetical protein ACI8XC_004627 [Gammaproteobacteria bacterium]